MGKKFYKANEYYKNTPSKTPPYPEYLLHHVLGLVFAGMCSTSKN